MERPNPVKPARPTHLFPLINDKYLIDTTNHIPYTPYLPYRVLIPIQNFHQSSSLKIPEINVGFSGHQWERGSGRDTTDTSISLHFWMKAFSRYKMGH